MFSGIVEERAVVVSLTKGKQSGRIAIKSGMDQRETRLGDSIAIDGVCLTVVEANGGELIFDVGSESFRRTSLGSLKPGDKVNLERALKVGERIHGHLVLGHVDGVVALLSRTTEGNTEKYVWELPRALKPFVAEKGSVSLAGVSLTVGEVAGDRFAIYIIPHTAALTNLSSVRPGQQVNMEVDMMARYVHSVISGERNSDDQEFLSVLERSGFPTK